jgi:hypothetical protein
LESDSGPSIEAMKGVGPITTNVEQYQLNLQRSLERFSPVWKPLSVVNDTITGIEIDSDLVIRSAKPQGPRCVTGYTYRHSYFAGLAV